MKLIETLRKKLTEKKNELNKVGITTKDDYYLNENIYTFETAYKKVVENVFKESYDNVTNSFDIYEEMIDGSCDETKMIEEIINHIDSRYLDEEIERTEVLGCKVEKGHTIEEYREKFGELYDNGELWDFSVADFEEGAVEPDPDKTYWLLEDEDGELRYFEVCENCVECKESKELNEGTSNFPIYFSREYELPLLIYFNYDEVLDKMDYEDDYPNEEDFEDEEDYWEAKEEFGEKYFNDFEYCILDEDEHERLEDKIFDFNSNSKELEYDSDYSHPKLSLEPGYYEASYIDIDHDLDYLKKNAPEEADKQYERLINFLNELKKEFGLTELELASGPASNGEASFRKVEDYKKKNKKNEGPLISMVPDPEKSTELLNKELDVGDIVCEDNKSLKEEDDVAREEYCLMVDGDNIDCYNDEEEAIKSARHYAKEMQDRGLDRNVRVLLVKYGPKDENGDEPELGVETVWARSFGENLKEDEQGYFDHPDEGDLINEFKTYKEAYSYLENLAKEEWGFNEDEFDIVEDSYYIPNGLLLIADNDGDEMTCLVAVEEWLGEDDLVDGKKPYKTFQEESLKEGKYADVSKEIAKEKEALAKYKEKLENASDEEKEQLDIDISNCEERIRDLEGELAEIRYIDNGDANNYDGYESLKEEKGCKHPDCVVKYTKPTKEDIDEYDPDFEICCKDVADGLDSGWWHGQTSSERNWGLTVNGGGGNQFSPLFADIVAYEVSYPVREGVFSFSGLDCIPNKSTFSYMDEEDWNDPDRLETLKNDLLSVGCDEADIEKFFKDEIPEIEFYIDYEIDIDDLEEETDESLKEGKTSAQKYNDKMHKIFDDAKKLHLAQKDFLIKNGVASEEAEKLYQDTGLHGSPLQQKLIDLGLKDEFFAKYDFKSGTLKEAYTEFDSKDGWTEEDIAKYKEISKDEWKENGYEIDVGDEFKGKVYIYRWNKEPEERDATFHKFLRANAIYPPYYRAVDFEDKDVVGPMYDGRKHGTYDVHDRYEDMKTNDLLSR